LRTSLNGDEAAMRGYVSMSETSVFAGSPQPAAAAHGGNDEIFGPFTSLPVPFTPQEDYYFNS